MENKCSSPFCARAPKEGREFDQEYIHYYEVESVANPKDFDPEHPEEFLVEKKTVEYERLPIDEYINQFASKVGLKNELRGVISKQQMDDFIAEHQAKPGFTDLTVLPDTAFEMSELAKKVDSAWDAIPAELKGSLTKEEFMKSITSQKIIDYVVSQVPKEEPKKED